MNNLANLATEMGFGIAIVFVVGLGVMAVWFGVRVAREEDAAEALEKEVEREVDEVGYSTNVDFVTSKIAAIERSKQPKNTVNSDWKD